MLIAIFLKYEMNLETHSLYCLTHKMIPADTEIAVKILLSGDVLCLIGYSVKNLGKNVEPAREWISNLTTVKSFRLPKVISQLNRPGSYLGTVMVGLARDG